MTDAQILRSQALTHRDEQRMDAAYDRILQAAKTAPDDTEIAFIRAQIAYETGRPAAALFDKAAQYDPQNLMLARNHAAAYLDAGRADEAIAMLEDRLAAQPNWIDGHRLIGNVYLAQDSSSDFARSYRLACMAEPQNLALRLAWFHVMSLAKKWDQARAIIDDGARLIGERPAFTLARIYIESESGAARQDTTLFNGTADIRDAGFDLCQIRFWLRYGDIARAEDIASRHIGTAGAAIFWPYLSLIWRLSDNPRAQWLDKPDQLIKVYDLDLSAMKLDQLAKILRELHGRRTHFLEQSVRGGTQTDGQLFFHHDQVIQNARQLVSVKVLEYINDLPNFDVDHPLLSTLPKNIGVDDLRFAGSWSVRLSAQGFHSCHTHNMGWISSALYIALPNDNMMGYPPAGQLAFGTPPPDLGLNLPAYRHVEPKVARLVLFPSTMWHGTVPFDDGERLSIAFDIRKPQ
jgi:tetratricopeptide (TPR) repeat protein